MLPPDITGFNLVRATELLHESGWEVARVERSVACGRGCDGPVWRVARALRAPGRRMVLTVVTETPLAVAEDADQRPERSR